jgi:hypothetical protein
VERETHAEKLILALKEEPAWSIGDTSRRPISQR